MIGRALVIRGDAFRLPLPDGCVDLIVTSPPYLWKRKYAIEGAGELGNEPDWRKFLANLWAVTDEMLRVLKPVGSIFVNLGDTRVTSREPKWLGVPVKSRLLLPERYRVGCQDRGIIVRQVQVWWKANGLPESIDDRTRDEHEDWVHLVKQPRYYSAIDEVRTPHITADRKGERRSYPAGSASGSIGANGEHHVHSWAGLPLNPLGALPGSVWSVPSEPLRLPDWLGVDHYASFPSEWPRRLILGWSPPGICVECGTGRFPVVDRQHEQLQVTNNSDQRANTIAEQVDGYNWRMESRHQGRASTEATILGYACGCTPHTDHPERRGTSWHPHDDDQGRGARTTEPQRPSGPREPVREYHLDGWQAPPTRRALVLDPFSGVGTTIGVARRLDRIGIGVDLSMPYCRAARWRVFDAGQFGKAERRSWSERQGTLT